jgi:hypothetical protein
MVAPWLPPELWRRTGRYLPCVKLSPTNKMCRGSIGGVGGRLPEPQPLVIVVRRTAPTASGRYMIQRNMAMQSMS